MDFSVSCFLSAENRKSSREILAQQKDMSSTAATLSSTDDASDSTRGARLTRQLVHPLLKYDPRALDYIEVIGLEYFEADTTKVSSHAPR